MISTTSPGDKFVFSYGSNNTYTMDLYNANALSIHEVFFINALSLVDSTFQFNSTQDSSTEKYIYNAGKQLVTLKEYNYSKISGSTLYNISEYTYQTNGDVNKENVNHNDVITYEYYPDLLNNLSFGRPYFSQPVHLVKAIHYNFNGDIQTTTHTYTFDDKKRITSEKITEDRGDFVIKSYTYY